MIIALRLFILLSYYFIVLAYKFLLLKLTLIKHIKWGDFLKKALPNCGISFIKLAQFLSTREDLFRNDIVTSLKQLEDKLPKIGGDWAIKKIQSSFRKPISEVFSYFNKEPIACASLAEVYYGVLKNGKKVAVKVLKPKVRKYFLQEIKILKLLIAFFNFFHCVRRLALYDIVLALESSAKIELDFKLEAGAATLFREKLELKSVYVPKVFWEYNTKDILVYEWIEGSSISSLCNKKEGLVAGTIIANAFFSQIFDIGMIHTDPHMGNFLYFRKNTIAFLDFGGITFITDKERYFIIKAFQYMFEREYNKLYDLHIYMKYISLEMSRNIFILEVKSTVERLYNGNVTFSSLFSALLALRYTFGIKNPSNMILMHKAIIYLEGILKSFNLDIMILMKIWFQKRKNLELYKNNLSYSFFQIWDEIKDIVFERSP